MQTTESENRKNKLLSDEESINFRPSPNFKHMKKYLKSKFEESSNPSTPNGNEDSSNHGHNDIQEKINDGDIHPPLPPNPPPPDSPLQLTLKQEIEDDEYEMNTSEMPADTNPTEEVSKELQTDQTEGARVKQGEEIMCRNFIRGTCNRGASCIFAHKIILSQLNEVYRFCNDFQNSICIRRKCRFVHATVFEKEYFLRTAFLPPHALNHLKQNNVLQPPPPPSPQPEEVPPTDVAATLNNHAPFPPLAGVTPVPMLSCAPTASLDSRNAVTDILRATENTSLKREWAEVDDFTSSPRDFDCGEPAAKKCKNCDINEIRLQLIKNKAVKLKRAEEELNKKIFITCKKSNKLLAVLGTLVKSLNSKMPGSARCLLTVSADKEKVLREQVPLLVSDNRMTLFPTKNSLNAGNVTFESILTKLLLSSRDQSLSPDGS